MADLVSVAILMTAVGTIVLAVCTLYYAWTNTKLLMLQEKELKKPKRRDELQFIIGPLLRESFFEIERVEKRMYINLARADSFLINNEKNLVERIMYQDFISSRKDLERLIEKHDTAFYKIRVTYNELFTEFTVKYKEHILSLIKKYNHAAPVKINKEGLSSLLTNLFIYLVEYPTETIIGEPDKSFWLHYKEELIKIKEAIPINTLYELGTSLDKINHELLDTLKNTCLEYSKEFGLTLEDETKFYSGFY